jgi:hypothetical protein
MEYRRSGKGNGRFRVETQIIIRFLAAYYQTGSPALLDFSF